MKGLFSEAPPLRRLDGLADPTLPESGLISEAASAAATVTLARCTECLQEGASAAPSLTGVADWFAACNEDFACVTMRGKRVKLTWDEFAASDAGHAVQSFAAAAAAGAGAEGVQIKSQPK